MHNKSKIIEKIVYSAILTALAIVLSYLERIIPFEMLIPIPGFRLGLSNIVLLFSVLRLTPAYTFSIAIIKSIVVSMLFGTLTGFFLSLTGGILAAFSMILIYFLLKKYISIAGLSIVGAAFHNIGQIIAACIVMQSIYVVYYLPFLLLVSIITGCLTGITVIILSKTADKTLKGLFKMLNKD